MDSKKTLQVILGAKPPFTSLPVQESIPREYPFSDQDKAEVRSALEDLLRESIVVPVEPSPDQFVSPIFLTTNKDGTRRPILNVKVINEAFLPRLHFKMETLASVLTLIRQGDWFASWDIRKGFFNIAIHPEMQKFFCFEFEGIRYMFTCLVMGLSVAPLMFSKVMAVLVQLAREWGIQVSFYIDDTLIRAHHEQKARRDTLRFGNLLQLAGFLLHEQKSVQEPTQVIHYLGFVINSRSMTVSLPDDKEKRLKTTVTKAIRDLKNGRILSIKLASSVIGFIVSTLLATTYGKAHFRRLERATLFALQENKFDYFAPFSWPQGCLADLTWWKNIPTPISASFEEKTPTTTVITDASLEGWGAIWNKNEIFGAWELDEFLIDELELRAILAAFEALPITEMHKTVLIRCDNQTAVHYINKQGGRVTRLDKVTRQIWSHLERHEAFAIATYIPTKENPADALTRGITNKKALLDIEVQLNPRIFADLCSCGLFQPLIDWFAADNNAQLDRFYVWIATNESAAEGFDAFLFDWGKEPGYSFPPFSLIPRILRKVVKEKARMLLVHPDWPGALWGPTLNEITVMRKKLEATADVLRYPNNPGLRHPMKNLRLAASWIDGASSIPTSGQR